MALPYWISGSISREQTYTGDDTYFENLRVTLRLGLRVTKVDSTAKRVVLSNGESLSFDNLLIATGSRPQAPSIPGIDLPGVQPLWSLSHAESVLESARNRDALRVVLVGAGFIGFIVLSAMFKRGWRLTVVERESQVLPRMLDEPAAATVAAWLHGQDVSVRTGTNVEGIREAGDGSKVVVLANGQQLSADLVIVATGILPNRELAAECGIEIDEGILIDHHMRTSCPSIFAAGDVAQGPVLLDDRRAIHAVQPTAVDHGRVAGANMAGHEVRYPGSLLMNVVDVCGLQCASFGRWNDADAEVTEIRNPSNYIHRKLLWRDDRLVGALLTGQANDLGMLTDVGMIKGLIQTQTRWGQWKAYLRDNPFDVRRAFVGTGVAAKLAQTTLLGRPTQDRKFHYRNSQPALSIGPSHAVFAQSKAE
jgi:NAD(P)H-nitrite reductase large subunit